MDRMAAKAGAALLALTLLLSAHAWGETPSGAEGKDRKAAAEGRQGKAGTAEKRRAPLQLEAVSITASPEQPAILFFLPRAKFRLLPLRTEQDWKARIVTETREMGDTPR